jgi:hypothetical protein
MKSAWYDENTLPDNMVKGIDGSLGWPKLEKSTHFKYLKEAMDICGGKTLIDLGCGGGEVGRVFSDLHYVGYDLPHIIEKVSKVVNPELNYYSFDAYETDFEFIKGSDIVLSNSFITELTNCTNIIGKIINKSEKYVILHRQKFKDSEVVNNYNTYGGLNTTNCAISNTEFLKLIENKFDVVYDVEYDDMKTIIIKKK